MMAIYCIRTFECLSAIEIYDSQIILFVQNNFRNDFGNWFFPFYTDLHKQFWFTLSFTLPVLIVWILKLGKAKITYFYFLVFNLIIVDVFCGQIIKKAFARQRPFVTFNQIEPISPASGFSFVSNHAANSIAIATILTSLYPNNKKVFYIVWSFALLTCFSRLYNGVHFLSDIIAGGLIGFIISKISLYFYNKQTVVKYNFNSKHLKIPNKESKG